MCACAQHSCLLKFQGKSLKRCFKFSILEIWWRLGESNSWPPACKAGALPTKLSPQLISLCICHLRLACAVVGLTRLELVTPRLSSVCSNQLSYRPWEIKKEINNLFFYFARQAQRVVHDLSLKLKEKTRSFSIFHPDTRRTTCCGFLPINQSFR